jgi:hypothetical protein
LKPSENDEREPKPAPLRVVGEIPRKSESETVQLCGREFTILQRPTIEGERYWFWALKRGGLTDLPRLPLEPPEDYRARLRTHLIDSGAAYKLMATRLVPRGEVWNAGTAGAVPSESTRTTALLLANPETENDIAVQLRIFELVLNDLVARFEVAP